MKNSHKLILSSLLIFPCMHYGAAAARPAKAITKCALRARKQFCPCMNRMESLNACIQSHKGIRQEIRARKKEMKLIKDPEARDGMRHCIDYWRRSLALRNLDVLYHAGTLNDAAKNNPECRAFLKQRKIDL
jgi:hypothetical protein